MDLQKELETHHLPMSSSSGPGGCLRDQTIVSLCVMGSFIMKYIEKIQRSMLTKLLENRNMRTSGVLLVTFLSPTLLSLPQSFPVPSHWLGWKSLLRAGTPLGAVQGDEEGEDPVLPLIGSHVVKALGCVLTATWEPMWFHQRPTVSRGSVLARLGPPFGQGSCPSMGCGL